MLQNNIALWLKLNLGENECFGVALNLKGKTCPICSKKDECKEEFERKKNV
jgi:hypothetical protein